jgi:hypothetical protein
MEMISIESTWAEISQKIDANFNLLNNKHGTTVLLPEFGSVGNGVTNDTLALQTAIDYCVANGATLLVPEGTYNVSTWTDKAITGNLKMVGLGDPKKNHVQEWQWQILLERGYMGSEHRILCLYYSDTEGIVSDG